MSEVWRPVKGYEGKYEVSSEGRVRSLDRGKVPGRMLSLRNEGHGYKQVALYDEGKRVDKRVHVLVAEAFIGPGPTGCEVNHRNGNKADNSMGNLEWTTHDENMDHAFVTGLHPHQRKPCVRSDGKTFPSVAAAARETGAIRAKIIACCQGYRKTTGGYGWRYAEEAAI